MGQLTLWRSDDPDILFSDRPRKPGAVEVKNELPCIEHFLPECLTYRNQMQFSPNMTLVPRKPSLLVTETTTLFVKEEKIKEEKKKKNM